MPESVELGTKHCKPCDGGTPPLASDRVRTLLRSVPDWVVEGASIARTFAFKDHYATMAFVNAVAFISRREDHHPVMAVGYKTCAVRYSTHFVGGLSEHDFICAAKVDPLLAG